MNLAHFHTLRIISIYTQGRSRTSLRVNVSVLIHRMHELEISRWQARVRGSGGMLDALLGALRCLLAHFPAV